MILVVLHACRMRAWERDLRTGAIWIAFILLTIFYAIPIGAIQALVEVDRLDTVPFFKQLLEISFVKALLQSVLPSAPLCRCCTSANHICSATTT